MTSPSRLAALALLGLLAACDSSQNVGSRYAKTALVAATTGGTVTVTAADDPTLAGASVQIAPGALAADTVVTVAEGAALPLPDGASACGPVVEFGPGDAGFAHPVTIVLPFQLGAGQGPDGLAVHAVDGTGTTVRVWGPDLVVNLDAGTVAFTASHLWRCGPVWGRPDAGVCPAGHSLCGGCGSGRCLPPGSPCPVAAPYCHRDGGVPSGGDGGAHGGGGDGGTAGGGRDGGTGGSCCPAGESFCGCGSLGTCLPAGTVCPLACPTPVDTTTPTCCGPGTYLCGCGGHGVCIPTTVACPLLCPVCQPGTIPTPCGCLPPGSTCGCDGATPSTVPCQCSPVSTVPATGPVCRVDAGTPCADPTEHLTPCGCLPAGELCVKPDAGTTCPAPFERQCCDGLCVGPGQACPAICPRDGGVTGPPAGDGGVVIIRPGDGGVCPSGTTPCSDGTCRLPGIACP